MTQQRPDRLYEYMPAAIDSLQNGFTIGVKYEKNTKYEYSKNGRAMRFRLPDRTVYVFTSMMPSHTRMLGIELDELTDMNYMLSKNLLGDYGYNFAMVNSHAVSAKYYANDWDNERNDRWPLIVADSGGFQLASGAAEYLDPTAIVTAQNYCCDIAVVLDIPMAHSIQEQFLLKAAQVQERNTRLFQKAKRKSLELLNVTHGSTFYLRQKYRDLIELDDVDRLAVAGLKSADLMPLALQSVNAMMTGKKYKQYHILGASGLERWIILAYIAHKKIAKLITSDSSSYIQCGVASGFFSHDKLLQMNKFGTSFKDVNWNRQLACGCPICSSVKYVKAYSDKTPFTFSGIIGHNLYTVGRYVDEIYDMVGQGKKVIMDNIRPLFNAKKVRDIGMALDAIDMAVQDGPQKAAKLYAPYLLEKFPRKHQTLFTPTTAGTSAERIANIIKRYEKTHGFKTK